LAQFAIGQGQSADFFVGVERGDVEVLVIQELAERRASLPAGVAPNRFCLHQQDDLWNDEQEVVTRMPLLNICGK